MDIISVRRQERLHHISVLQEALEKAEEPDYNEAVMQCMSNWGVSERTAKEYVKIARYNIKSKK